MRDVNHPIGIIGAGAVGTILGAHFGRMGRPTVVVESGPRFDGIERDGLVVTGQARISARPSHLVRSLTELSGEERSRVRLWCICTKTWSFPALVPSLARLLPDDATVLSVQNGLGAEEMLAGALGAHRVACAVVNFAGGPERDSNAVRLAWFTPPNHVGAFEGNGTLSAELATLFTDAGLHTEASSSDEIRRELFYKTALSAGLNALCAVTGITMQQAMNLPHTRCIARDLVREALEVGRALGHTFAPDTLEHAMRYLDRGGDHRPSMATDLLGNNPTEIEFINGKIVELGMRFPHVSVATNWFVTAMVITEEIKNGTRLADRVPDYLQRCPKR